LAGPFRLFLQNYPFASARLSSRQFSVCVTTAKEILVRGLCLKNFTRRWAPDTLSDPQNVTRVEASNELLQILNDSEVDFFDGVTTATSHGFIISMSHQPCLRGRQVMSFQEREKTLV
jgi:hypothetical protein